MIIKLNSVGSVYNTETKCLYPAYIDGGYDEEAAFPVTDLPSDDWLEGLDKDDKKMYKLILKSGGLNVNKLQPGLIN